MDTKLVLSLMGFVGFSMFAFGIFLQNRKVWKVQNIASISLGEVRFRTVASVLSTIGVCISGSRWLIVGALVNCIMMMWYCCSVHRIHYKGRVV
jgi:uncharacterized protein with PQ loop repeat